MNNLKAVFVLTFEDKLSSGLARIKGDFEQLKNLGGKLTLGKLGEGVGILRQIGGEVRGLTNSLHGLAAMADRAWSRLKQMSAAPIRHMKNAIGAESKLGAFGAAAQGYSIIAPVRTYAPFEDVARSAAITRGLSGAAATAETNRLMLFFRKEARDTGQGTLTVAEAYLDMLHNRISPSEAEKLLPIHSLAATTYGINAVDLGNVVQALVNSFKIADPHAVAGALASMAMASQSGKFGVADFSRFLPMIGGQMNLMGMTGRASFDTVAAALETVTQNSTDPAAAATNLYDALRYILSPFAARSFAMKGRMVPPEIKRMMQDSKGLFGAAGIDLPDVLIKSEKQGINPLFAVLGKLALLTKGKTPVEAGEMFGALLHNQQAGIALASLVMNSGLFESLRTKFGTATEGKLNRDAATRMDGAAVKTKKFGVALEQLGETLGRGFLPIVSVVNVGLMWLLDRLDHLEASFPGVENGTLLAVGGMLSFGAAVSTLGFVLPIFSTGLKAVGSGLWVMLKPLRLAWGAATPLVEALGAIGGISAGAAAVILMVAAVLTAAAIDIYEHWSRFSRFFADLFHGLVNVFGGFFEFVIGIVTGNMSLAVAGLKRTWHGLTGFFGAEFGILKQLFLDLVHTIDGWTGGKIMAVFHGIADAVAGVVAKFHEFMNFVQNSAVARFFHLSDAPQLRPPSAAGKARGDAGDLMIPGTMPQINGHITVGVDPNNGQIRVQQARSSTPGLSFFTSLPEPGLVLGVP